MLYPLTFKPIFKERVWGGRRLADLYAKPLPPGRPIGESWELCDRPEDVSIIANGPLAGRDLHWLIEHQGEELLGRSRLCPETGRMPVPPFRFPWLIKILDAQDKLSLQVHPPAAIAAELGGEPKTEMWYVASATPDADIFVGLKRGVTRPDFERKTVDGTVAECFHRIAVKPGDCMFLRSGRVHALGAGSVIFEIQQNSDTTYRVFDWNRVGLDGQPRELHVAQSLRSIDFNDFAPALIARAELPTDFGQRRPLVDDPLFRVDKLTIRTGRIAALADRTLQVIGLLDGSAMLESPAGSVTLAAGQFALVPACLAQARIAASANTELLRVQPPMQDRTRPASAQ